MLIVKNTLKSSDVKGSCNNRLGGYASHIYMPQLYKGIKMLEVKKIIQDDNIVTLRLVGELDFHTSTDLRVALEEVMANKIDTLILDLDKVILIDSSGIGMLLLAAKEMEKKNGKTILIAHKFVWELLNITRLADFFEKAADEREAKVIATRTA